MTADPGPLPPDVAAALVRLDDLVGLFEEHPDANAQDAAIQMLQAVDCVHRGALERLRALLDANGLLDEALADSHVALLFALYESQADDEQSRAEAAVAAIRPDIESHGGRLDVVAAEDGIVTIRLLSGCESCSASAATLRGLVEDALRAALPHFVRMDVAAPPPRPSAPVLIPAASLTLPRTHAAGPDDAGAS